MNVLILAPHADDEVLGCGGLISRRVQDGHTVDVAVASIGTVHLSDNTIKATAKRRRTEMEEAGRRLGVHSSRVLFEDVENQLDTIPMLKIVSALDMILREKSYHQVFLPYPSHHQDHEILYRAGFSALRTKGSGCTPSLIALYEYPYVSWTPNQWPGGRLYLDIGEHLETKLHALAAYESQVAPPPHPTSVEAVRTLAAMRGMECGRLFAELFYVVKMVE